MSPSIPLAPHAWARTTTTTGVVELGQTEEMRRHAKKVRRTAPPPLAYRVIIITAAAIRPALLRALILRLCTRPARNALRRTAIGV